MGWVWLLSCQSSRTWPTHMMRPFGFLKPNIIGFSIFLAILPSVFFIICLSFSNFLHSTLTQSSSVIFPFSFHSLQFCLVLFFIFSCSLSPWCSVSLLLSSFCLFYFLPFELLFHSLLLFSHTFPLVCCLFLKQYTSFMSLWRSHSRLLMVCWLRSTLYPCIWKLLCCSVEKLPMQSVKVWSYLRK